MSPDLDELRRLSEAATRGPWSPDVMYVVGQVKGGRPGGEVIARAGMTVRPHRADTEQQQRADAAFIAASANYVRDRLAAHPKEGSGE